MGPASSGSSERSWKEPENTCAPSRRRSRGRGDPHHHPARALGQAELTQEPGMRQQDSWTLQTKSLPFVRSRNSHLRKASSEAPWAVGSGLGLSEDPPHRPGLAPWTPWAGVPPFAPTYPTPVGAAGAPGWWALAGKLFWRQTLEHQGRNSRSAVPTESPRPRSLRLDTPGTGEGRLARRARTWGTTWHARSRGRRLAPSSADPRSRRNTSPCPAGLDGVKTLVLTSPGPLHSLCVPQGQGWALPGGLSL